VWQRLGVQILHDQRVDGVVELGVRQDPASEDEQRLAGRFVETFHFQRPRRGSAPAPQRRRARPEGADQDAGTLQEFAPADGGGSTLLTAIAWVDIVVSSFAQWRAASVSDVMAVPLQHLDLVTSGSCMKKKRAISRSPALNSLMGLGAMPCPVSRACSASRSPTVTRRCHSPCHACTLGPPCSTSARLEVVFGVAQVGERKSESRVARHFQPEGIR